MKKYSRIINSVNFNHSILNTHDWEFLRDQIIEYLDEKMEEVGIQQGRAYRGSLSTYCRYYNKFSTCSKYGYKKLLYNMPQFLLLELYEYLNE